MWDKIISLIDALIIHICFVAILVLNFNWPNIFSSITAPTTEPEAKKSLIDESAVLTELDRLKREEDFKSTVQRAQEYTLQQKKLEYEYLVSQENAHLEDLDKQQQKIRQQLKDLKQRRLSEEAYLKELQREKSKIR
jgi:membrane protein involved in colicin uptake